MAILKNQEIWFAKLVAGRPDKNKFDPTRPNWNLQCRTTDKAKRKEWMELGLKPRTVRVDAEDDESPIAYYSVSFRKSAIKVDKITKVVTKANPPEVVDGKNKEMDPSTIGNGSIANLRLLKNDFEVGGEKKSNYILMGVQLVKHIIYTGTQMEEFEECDTETVVPEDKPSEKDSDDEDLY